MEGLEEGVWNGRYYFDVMMHDNDVSFLSRYILVNIALSKSLVPATNSLTVELFQCLEVL